MESESVVPVTPDGDELYLNGIFEFNITKLLEFINTNKDKFHPEKVEVKAVRAFRSNNLNESTIKSADLSIPIIYLFVL